LRFEFLELFAHRACFSHLASGVERKHLLLQLSQRFSRDY
jgi:hypothetical protein